VSLVRLLPLVCSVQSHHVFIQPALLCSLSLGLGWAWVFTDVMCQENFKFWESPKQDCIHFKTLRQDNPILYAIQLAKLYNLHEQC